MDEWVPYAERPEWKDVTPVPQDDGPVPIVQIAYSDKFKDIFNYFRAVLSKREISKRALRLCDDAVSINSSSYTVWHYRRILLQEIKEDLLEELQYTENVIEDNPKNYQVWHHRQVLVEWLKDASHEKKLTRLILSEDPKNYHAWQHWQWVVSTFNMWDKELEFSEVLIRSDVRNNSAWNYRYFVRSHTQKPPLAEDIDYTLEMVEKAPHNESPWNYLRGILQDDGLSQSSKVCDFCEKLFESGVRSPHLLAFLVDVAEEKMLAEPQQHLLQRALEGPYIG